MRNDWSARAFVVLGFVLAAAGCTTTQPESIGTRTASVHILSKATVTIFNCYEVWATDANGIYVYQDFNECYPAPPADVPTERSIPWRYAVMITIIRVGTTQEEIAISLTGVVGSSILPGDGVPNFISLTEYDPTAQPGDPRPDENRQGYGIIQFRSPQKVSRGSPLWLAPSGFTVEDSNILSASPSFDFEVNSGDTVIVRARKQLRADGTNFLQAAPPPNITLSGTLSVGGSLVTPKGTTKSTIADGDGISFSFTVK